MPRPLRLPDASDTEALGARLARACEPGLRVHLHGDLAAGKTTLARGFLRALGHAGAVKSPTFTLVESYELDGRAVHHFDLHRLASGEELEFIGIDEYFEQGADCLVEWAERGGDWLPAADLAIRLVVTDEGREAVLTPATERGSAVVSRIINTSESDA